MKKKALSIAAGTALVAGSALSSIAVAADNPFALRKLEQGYQLAQADDKQKDAKCGSEHQKNADGKCGSDKKPAKKAEKKTIPAKPDPKKSKMKDGKCGEGMCGGAKS